MISLFKVFMTKKAANAAKSTLLSGSLTQGLQVEKFETMLSDFFNYKYLATVNNATAGLHLALRLAGVKPQDTVISTPLTCFATNVSILGTYASIRWADVDPETCNIDIDDVVEKVDTDISAIVLVHWGGIPVDVETLKGKVENKLGFCPPIIEDCAHSFGALHKGGQAKVGANGNYCSFSFQAIKHLSTGDGGVLTIPEKDFQRAKLLRWYGIDRDHNKNNKKDFRSEIPITEWGYKYHMNDITASIGIQNLKEVQKKVIDLHRDNAAFYNKELIGIAGISLFKIPELSNPSYWLYTIKVEDRENFRLAMLSRGITTSQVHMRNDTHPCVSEFSIELPKLDTFCNNYICIPVGWWVSKEDREYIVEAIKKGW